MLRIHPSSPACDTRHYSRDVSRIDLGCLLIGLVCSVLSTCLPTPCYAESDHDGELDRWVFSGALEVGVFAHTGKGSAEGTPLTGPRISPNLIAGDGPDNVVEPLSDREDLVGALIGGTLEAMTPKLFSTPGRPRLFLDVNVSSVLSSEVGMSRIGDIGNVALPPDRAPNLILGETVLLGVGNEVSAQQQGPQVHAGFGAAFTLDFGTNRIRIKPSVVYSRTILEVAAVTQRAVRLVNDLGPALGLDDYRYIMLNDDRTEVYHGMGPALEIEYETGNRLGPFTVTLFIKGHASHIFGGLKTRLQQANPDYPDELVRYKFTQDRWNYRASTGVRFRWVPKEKKRGRRKKK